ncbi:MAG: hypothetical protein CNE97_00560 [alpha proteobacterium MED-G10]|nr:hypothetical protein [Rickettsiales bacterium]PDH56726.1 MAG: hypothetical protein CNE97_00560 [alpha proteobacterium MED-G10]|tara:strand:+ start:2601 stop:2993 length:393 start_codon:yes stop_codon:yes gene_type:complete
MNLKLILLIPIIEILLFVLFGDFLGFFVVLLLIITTGVVGLLILRSNVSISEIKELASNPNDWLYRKVSGVLLLIPGFFTDILALVMLVKGLRNIVWKFLISQKSRQKEERKDEKDKVIEAEYRDLDEDR